MNTENKRKCICIHTYISMNRIGKIYNEYLTYLTYPMELNGIELKAKKKASTKEKGKNKTKPNPSSIGHERFIKVMNDVSSCRAVAGGGASFGQ